MADNATTWWIVREFMARTCGLVLRDDQQYLLEPRLGPEAKRANFPSIQEFVVAACASSAPVPLTHALVDAMTTHETFFFRDATFWRDFENVIVPRLFTNGPRPLRVWSAACAHGQEPYSIAMMLEERWPEIADASQIVATDVSARAIERAREGLYTTFETNRGLGASRLLRHFEQAKGGFAVRPTLRSRIKWATDNLMREASAWGTFDVILCRNVLIYFSEADRRAVLSRLVGATRPHGYIALGATERWDTRTPLSPGWYANETPPR